MGTFTILLYYFDYFMHSHFTDEHNLAQTFYEFSENLPISPCFVLVQ